MMNEKKILLKHIAAAPVCKATCFNQFTTKILSKEQNCPVLKLLI